jgi:hypothetical protein
MQEQYYKLALRVAKLEDRINKEWGSQCNTCGHIKKAEAVVEGCQAVSEPETASMCEFTGKCTCKPLAVQVA